MTPSQRIHQLERDNAKLRQRVETQASTVEKYRRQFMDAKRKLAKERGRNAPLQNMVDYYRALSCPIQQAERLFNDQQG